jgi:hypothetical protein
MFMTSRRNLLLSLGAGLGPVALSNLLQAEDKRRAPLALQPPMFAPRAKRVIMLFMEGGPGHMDTFDPKPELTRRHKEESKLPGGLAKGV